MAKEKDGNKDKSASDVASGEGQDGAVVPAKPKSKLAGLVSKKMLLFAGAPLLVLLLAGGGYVFMSGGDDEIAAGGIEGENSHSAAAEAHPVFFEVPDILVNVATNNQKPAFLKLSVSLEVDGVEEELHAQLDPIMPRVVDQLQTYLRELRIEDLSGSAAMFRLKEELLRRVNMAIEPVKVKNVLFREMIIQ